MLFWFATGTLVAQRSGFGFQGHSGGLGYPHGMQGQYRARGISGRRSYFSPRSSLIGDYPYLLDYDGYEDQVAPPESELSVPAPREREFTPAEERPVRDAELIEIPGPAASTTKATPQAIFILTTGERVESQRFLLTASSLSVTVHRASRLIPFELLDVDATLAANHDRGIDLRIPSDHNEISLSF